ncbi:MAG TPA: SDR family oxidoreductase [Anaerolineales bacterium]|nr:SDR family oxidoreductase [Anaerolineales bacterium]HRQ92638.1 SDR family oxidoreductase [Anaerolineales bacterium]
MTTPVQAIFITGASTGIGRACAVYLAQRGWRVFAGVRRVSDGRALTVASANITPIVVDVTKAAQITRAIKTVQKAVGRNGLQALVNNAGIAVTGPLEFLQIDELRRQFEVNFIGQVAFTQACLPLLRSGRGRVINVSSISGKVAAPLLVPYSASKFALEAFTDGLRRELSPWKLPVVSIVAGSIATPIWKKTIDTADHMRTGLPRRAESLYGPMIARGYQRAERSAARGVPVEQFAALVERILLAERPRTRYIIGTGTWLAATLARLLPDRWMDAIIRHTY